nr:IS630 family transposase [Colwellia sp. 20A7]
MTHNLSQLISSTSNARMRLRLLAVSHFIDGKNRTQIATFLKVSRTSVNKWIHTYLHDGLEGLKEKKHTGRPKSLDDKQLSQLKSFVINSAIKPSGGRLQGKDVQEYIATEFGVVYQKSNVYDTLHQLELSWVTTRSKHPKQSIETQETFKKFQFETIAKIPLSISLDQVDVWFQDEARFGQQNTTTRVWAEKGTRPRAIKQQQFTYAYLFGAVCITNGKTEAIVAPLSNMDVMASHLALISKATEEGRHAVVLMDGASWHQKYLDDEYNNLTIIHIPPYSPELNPIEQVWSWMRQNEIANRCFKDYEDIVEKCSEAWNRFRSNTKRVISLCHRDWAIMTS